MTGSAPDKFDEDRFLDQALLSYTPAEPRPGLEDRVRAHLNAAGNFPSHRPGSRLLFPWAVGIGLVIAAMLLVALVLRPPMHSAPTSIVALQAKPPVAIIPQQHFMPPVSKPLTSSRRLAAQKQPRLLRQPSQQQLIAQLLAIAPNSIAGLARSREMLSQPVPIQPLSADPMVIVPIKVTPLDDHSANAGGK